MQRLSDVTATVEIPLNIALIVVFLGLGIALAMTKEEQLRPVLISSIVVSLVIWYFAQASGGILSGMATDFNSGLLLVVIALACWPKVHVFHAARARFARELKEVDVGACAAVAMCGDGVVFTADPVLLTGPHRLR